MSIDNNNILSSSQIDFKEILDNIDESVFIADGEGRTLYVNPSYTRNTGILASEVLGKTAYDLEKEGLFTRGAVTTVLETGKSCLILCTTFRSEPPRPGYVSGVPIFDDNGKIKLVIASSRPIKTLTNLQEYYSQFLIEAKSNVKNIKIIHSPDDESQAMAIGSSPAMANVHELIKRVAQTDVTVLITGESGVGKEVVSDEIYRLSDRADKPFIKVNCAAIPDSLLESELFGYEKGAFSNADVKGKKGLFELANSGTLLLDEIGEMPLDLQAKLLRAIQSRTILRVGGTTPISLDIRIIAATNCNLLEHVHQGKFRQDLYYRLCVFPIPVPPLRERKEDIPLFCEHFATTVSKKFNREFTFTKKELELLQKYDWPGNVRELENLVQYFALCRKNDDKFNLEMLAELTDATTATIPVQNNGSMSRSVQNVEKTLIEDALSKSSNLREAGKLLNISAATLSRKIKHYGIEYSRSRT